MLSLMALLDCQAIPEKLLYNKNATRIEFVTSITALS